ncbi:MFS transporter [Nocardioides yefusunii]|uniref:MFS transporter n=1 Tax=Nocardioides yefusunii TaxID=2500546 RepID=A0ABW1QZA1_9ACTN|nr:MFS transporter [Nocardioides yefusunii]
MNVSSPSTDAATDASTAPTSADPAVDPAAGSTPPLTSTGDPYDSRRFVLAVLALAVGGFAIGTTEFVSMGLLPQMARATDVSIPSAGHAISAYAIGVVIGAPTMAVLGARWPRRNALLGFMALFAVGNIATALVSSYDGLLLARFVAGLPHGAYFGVASLLAASMARQGREGRAVATVMMGLSVANLLGVPMATWLGQTIGWRAAYWVVAALGLLTFALVVACIPRRPGDATASWRTELGVFKKPQVLITLVAGAVGFGGMFAVYSYVVPTLTEVGGLDESAAPVFLFVFGLGMVLGTWLAGEMSSWSIFGSLFVGSIGQGLCLLAFAAFAASGWWTLPLVMGITTFGSILVVNLQVRLMSVTSEAPTIGAAMNHAALNMANALGAWLGGLVIAAGWGYRAPGVVGFGLAAVGAFVLFASWGLERRTRAVL